MTGKWRGRYSIPTITSELIRLNASCSQLCIQNYCEASPGRVSEGSFSSVQPEFSRCWAAAVKGGADSPQPARGQHPGMAPKVGSAPRTSLSQWTSANDPTTWKCPWWWQLGSMVFSFVSPKSSSFQFTQAFNGGNLYQANKKKLIHKTPKCVNYNKGTTS